MWPTGLKLAELDGCCGDEGLEWESSGGVVGSVEEETKELVETVGPKAAGVEEEEEGGRYQSRAFP